MPAASAAPAPAPTPEPLAALAAAAAEPEPAPGPATTPAAVPAPAPTEQPVATPEPATAPAAPVDDSRLALLADILETFKAYPDYQAAYGTDTDVSIDNHIASAAWGIGRKKIDYSAVLKAVEPERTIYFWELIKEQGAGMSFGGFESETYSTFGAERSGTTKAAVLGPNGVEMSYEWDYGSTRSIVQSVAAKHGWKLKTVLRKSSAQW
jgi:hypothetical protein